MPRKRVVTRELDITIATCLFVNPVKKEQKKIKIELAGSFNPRQVDLKKPASSDSKMIFVKCTRTVLARAKYEMSLDDYLKYANRKEMNYYNEKEEKETNKNSH